MQIFEFLDTKFQITSKQIGESKGMDYSLMQAGRLQALHASINFLRNAAKWVSIPMIFGEFLLVKLHILTPPVSPLKITPANIDPRGNGEKTGLEATSTELGAKA